MTACVSVRGGVAIRGVVTADRRAAGLTGAQMHPLRANLHTLFALPPLRMFDTRNRLYVRASFFSHRRPSNRRFLIQ
jgi:hypothetical protein